MRIRKNFPLWEVFSYSAVLSMFSAGAVVAAVAAAFVAAVACGEVVFALVSRCVFVVASVAVLVSAGGGTVVTCVVVSNRCSLQ